MTAPARPWLRRGLTLLLLAAAALSLAWWSARAAPARTVPTHLALLLPDGWSADDVQVQAWQDAAAETGFPLRLLSASELVRAPASHRDAALVVPDVLHRRMNDALLAHLEQRVHDGALLMLVHDAGVADMDGHYHPQQSRLSALAGVRYALYGSLGAANGGVWTSALLLKRNAEQTTIGAASECNCNFGVCTVSTKQPCPLPPCMVPPTCADGQVLAAKSKGKLKTPLGTVRAVDQPFGRHPAQRRPGGQPQRGQHPVAGPQVLFDGFRLGRRFNNYKLHNRSETFSRVYARG